MKRYSFKLTVTALTIGFSVSAGVLAQSSSAGNSTAATPGPVAAAVKSPVVVVESTSISGKVAAINPGIRHAGVTGDNGRMAAMFVGPNLRNFENLSSAIGWRFAVPKRSRWESARGARAPSRS